LMRGLLGERKTFEIGTHSTASVANEHSSAPAGRKIGTILEWRRERRGRA
jgi:hypothetical protein